MDLGYRFCLFRISKGLRFVKHIKLIAKDLSLLTLTPELILSHLDNDLSKRIYLLLKEFILFCKGRYLLLLSVDLNDIILLFYRCGQTQNLLQNLHLHYTNKPLRNLMFTRVFRGFYVTISLVDLPRIYMLYSGRLFYVQTLHQPVKLLPAKRLNFIFSPGPSEPSGF